MLSETRAAESTHFLARPVATSSIELPIQALNLGLILMNTFYEEQESR